MRSAGCSSRATEELRSSRASANAAGQNGATACESDERDRLQQLYRDHSTSLVRQLTRKTGCSELARDLANEAFLKLLRMAPGSLSRIEHPEAFLRHVSINLLRDWARATAMRKRAQIPLEIAADRRDFDQIAALESRDTLNRLEHAIAKLRPKTREIFLDHRIRGFTYTEIAKRRGLSIKGVEKQMSKAIAKIDQLVDRN